MPTAVVRSVYESKLPFVFRRYTQADLDEGLSRPPPDAKPPFMPIHERAMPWLRVAEIDAAR